MQASKLRTIDACLRTAAALRCVAGRVRVIERTGFLDGQIAGCAALLVLRGERWLCRCDVMERWVRLPCAMEAGAVEAMREVSFLRGWREGKHVASVFMAR